MADSASPSEELPEGRLSADRPINDYSLDLLHRRPFVEALAEDVRAAPRASGFVIGLNGPWGDGKTSVLELLAKELKDDTLATIQFNPWLFSGTEQLVDHFFTELAGQLEAEGGERLRGVARALRGYGRVVGPLRYVPYLGEAFRVSGELANDLGGAAEQQAPQSAHERAQVLRTQLSALPKPILVTVDDLDRLRDDEVVDAVRLVRLVGDFPNLIYALAFDRPAIEASLGKKGRVDGRAYLDKIVHLSYELPRIRDEDLTVILSEALEGVVKPSQLRFDQGRLNTVFWMAARELFHTVRDVRRYANVLPGALRLVGEEIDFADLMALEALRLFEPESFEAAVAARFALTGARSALDFGTDRSQQAAEIQAVFDAASDRHRPVVERLIRRLFPAAEEYLGNTTYDGSIKGEWRAAGLVAAQSVFDTYLHRRLPPGELPAREVEAAIGALNEGPAFDALAGGLSEQELSQLFVRISEHERSFPGEPVQAIAAILRQQNRLPGNRDFFKSPVDIAATRLIYRLLRHLGPDEVETVVGAIEYPDLSGRCELVRLVGHRPRVGQQLVSKAAAKRLETDLVDRFLRTSATELRSQYELGPLLGLARSHRATELRDRLIEWIEDDRFLVRLISLNKLESRGGTIGSGSISRTLQLNWPALTSLVSPKHLDPRIEAIDSEWIAAEFDADTTDLWRQAERYKADPEAAERDMRRYENDDDDVEPEPDADEGGEGTATETSEPRSGNEDR